MSIQGNAAVELAMDELIALHEKNRNNRRSNEECLALLLIRIDEVRDVACKSMSYLTHEDCPRCFVGHVVRRRGPHGNFLGCSQFPGCRWNESIHDRSDAPLGSEDDWSIMFNPYEDGSADPTEAAALAEDWYGS